MSIKTLNTLVLLSALLSCNSDEPPNEMKPVLPIDFEAQRRLDLEIIDQYLIDSEYSDLRVDTTFSGARYIILNYGDTLARANLIDDNDSVEFHYTGRLVDNLIFSSSIDSITQAEGLGNENPISLLYLESGENIESVYIKGFSEGITTTFNQVGINSHILLLLPSDIGYGRFPSPFIKELDGEIITLEIPANSVVIWDLMPFDLIKQ